MVKRMYFGPNHCNNDCNTWRTKKGSIICRLQIVTKLFEQGYIMVLVYSIIFQCQIDLMHQTMYLDNLTKDNEHRTLSSSTNMVSTCCAEPWVFIITICTIIGPITKILKITHVEWMSSLVLFYVVPTLFALNWEIQFPLEMGNTSLFPKDFFCIYNSSLL